MIFGAPTAQTASASPAFAEWCTSNGITTPLRLVSLVTEPPPSAFDLLLGKVPEESENAPTGRGGGKAGRRYMAPVSDLPANEPLLRVPLSSCIIDATHEGLADRLSYEQSLGEESRFAPFLELFPTLEEEDSPLLELPRFWNEELIDLVAEFDGGEITRRMEGDPFANIGEKKVDPWAAASVMTRANFLDDFRLSLTPVLDLLDHDCSVKTKAKVDRSGSSTESKGFSSSSTMKQGKQGDLVMTVDRPYKAGEEVRISYGDLTNAETLVQYGFVSPANRANAESFSVRVPRSSSSITATISSDGTIDLESLARIRFELATSEEREERGLDVISYVAPVSARNEDEVLGLVSAELYDAVDVAREGRGKVAEKRERIGFGGGVDVAELYLEERARLLDRGLKAVEGKLESLALGGI